MLRGPMSIQTLKRTQSDPEIYPIECSHYRDKNICCMISSTDRNVEKQAHSLLPVEMKISPIWGDI